MEANKVPFVYERDAFVYPLAAKGRCAECGSTKVVRLKTYLADFAVYPNGRLNSAGGFILETKGKFTSVDRTKMLAVIKEHPEVRFRMLFMADNKLNKNSETRYSDWCKKNGIEFAVGKFLPPSWIKKAKRKLA